MERFTDLLNNIKERFSNPLVFSFICSWLIINWPITVGLLWFNPQQIENAGYKSIFDLIQSRINSTGSLCYPLLFALAYTFLMPPLKNLIRFFYSWTSKWGDNWNLKILDGSKISINKYLNLRADHEKRSKILEEVISKESAYIENFNAVNTELLEIKNELNETSQKKNSMDIFMQKFRNPSILDGTWENNYEIQNGEKGVESILIQSGQYYVINTFGDRQYTFDIRDFIFDSRSGTVFFVKELTHDKKKTRPVSEHYNINRLTLENNDLMVGTENGTTKISYKRK